MKYGELIKKCSDLPLIESKTAAAIFQERETDVARQFGRWVKTGQLIQLKRGIYLLPKEYGGKQFNGYYLACVLLRPSYISLEKALEFYGLIPEGVFVYTALTTRRANFFSNLAGKFSYRHIQPGLFWGYDTVEKGNTAFYLATPEKALLDYIYVNRVSIDQGFLQELRLQNTREVINKKKLLMTAERFKKKNILQAARLIIEYLEQEEQQEKIL